MKKILFMLISLATLVAFTSMLTMARDSSIQPVITIRFAPSPGYFAEGEGYARTGSFGFRLNRLPEPVAPEGYVFIGWFFNGTELAAPLAAVRNVTLLAAYAPDIDPNEAESFIILYDPGTGQMPQGAPLIKSYTYGSAITNLPVPTLAGHSFEGWAWEDEAIAAPYIVRGDMILTALWAASTDLPVTVTPTYPQPIPADHFVVAFSSFPGSFPAGEVGFRFGRGVTVMRDMPPDPVRNNHIFVGWRLPDGEMLVNPRLFRYDTLVTAVWEALEDAEAGSEPPPTDSRRNPETSPLAISFMVFGAVLCLCLVALVALYIRKKRLDNALEYRAGMARYVREARIVIKGGK